MEQELTIKLNEADLVNLLYEHAKTVCSEDLDRFEQWRTYWYDTKKSTKRPISIPVVEIKLTKKIK